LVDNALNDIVRKVFVRPDGTGCQAVALVYARPEEKATLLCASLANLLGDLHGKVLAISARELLIAAAGKRESGEAHFVKIGNSSVWVAPAVCDCPVPQSEACNLDIAITNLRDQFDFVVIDGGSFLDLKRVEAVARHIDGFLVVVNEASTAVRDLVEVRQRIQKNGGHILGSVYSSARASSMAGAR
jgi:hypothetical protein